MNEQENPEAYLFFLACQYQNERQSETPLSALINYTVDLG